MSRVPASIAAVAWEPSDCKDQMMESAQPPCRVVCAVTRPGVRTTRPAASKATITKIANHFFIVVQLRATEKEALLPRRAGRKASLAYLCVSPTVGRPLACGLVPFEN